MARLGSTKVVVLGSVLIAGGCVGYDETTRAARAAFYAHDQVQAKKLYSELIEGQGSDKDRVLYLLERAMVQLADGTYEAAAGDLNAADAQLEVMDFTGDLGQIGRFLFSEDSGLYRGPPHEKILIPTLAAIAYASLGDLKRAKTAANAAYSQVVRFDQLRPEVRFPSPLAHVLLGLAAELDGDTQRAFAAFRNAYALRPIRSLEPVLGRLLAENVKRHGGHWIHDAQTAPAAWRATPHRAEGEGELVVLVLNGRAPVRVSSLMPMTEEQHASFIAMSLATLTAQQPDADPAEAMQRLQPQNLLPMAVLAQRPSAYQTGHLELSGAAAIELENVLPVGEQVERWFEANKNVQMAAALSRLAFKMAVQVGTYLVTKKNLEQQNAAIQAQQGAENQAQQNADNEMKALLASALVGAFLFSIDTPDTRCWSLLPDSVLLQRCPLPAGSQSFKLRLAGEGGQLTLERTVEILPGQMSFVLAVVPD